MIEEGRDVDLELDHGRGMSGKRDMEVSLSFSLSFSLEWSRNVANREEECRREWLFRSAAEVDFSE